MSNELKFNFEVLLPEEVGLARKIIEERIAASAAMYQQAERLANQGGISDLSKIGDSKKHLEEAQRLQKIMRKFDDDYLDYLTSELKALPAFELEEDDPKPY